MNMQQASNLRKSADSITENVFDDDSQKRGDEFYYSGN